MASRGRAQYTEQGYAKRKSYIYDYVKENYHCLNLKLEPERKLAWKAAQDSSNINSLHEWVVLSCRTQAENNTVRLLLQDKRVRGPVRKQYSLLNLRLKDKDYDKFKSAAEELGLPLATWIKKTCDMNAGI